MTTLSLEQLEKLRDVTYCRTPERRVRTLEEAARFVDASGIAFAFSAGHSELPCLRHAACGRRDPDMPRHTHHDPAIGLVWEAKDTLPLQKRIYYGKALRKRPTMISLELLPYFYAAKSHPPDPFTGLSRGSVSPIAYRIARVLESGPPQTTRELKIAAGCPRPRDRAAFDRAMADLQERMLIVKIAEEYEPFTFIWGRLDKWLERPIAASKAVSALGGRKAVLAKILSRVVAARARDIERLFGWSAQTVEEVVEMLKAEGTLSDQIVIPGKGWIIHSDYV